MDEYARILRSCVWLRPPHPPMSVEIRPREIIRCGLRKGAIWLRRIKGASFCQVDKISPVMRSKPWSTSGSQKCTGARPIFKARARRISVEERG